LPQVTDLPPTLAEMGELLRETERAKGGQPYQRDSTGRAGRPVETGRAGRPVSEPTLR